MNIRPRDRRPTRRSCASSGRSSRPRSRRRPSIVETWDEEWQDVAADIDGRGAVYLAEDDDGVVGSVRARRCSSGDVWHIVFAHVRPRARQQGVLKALLREPRSPRGAARGSTRVTLDVLAVERGGASSSGSGSASRSSSTTWRRRSTPSRATARARRSPAVERRDLRPDRRPRRGRAGGRQVPAADRALGVDDGRPQPANGWTRVDDELCSRDPKALRRLGRELSLAHRRGRAHARGRGGGGRPLHPLGPRRDRRRVRVACRSTTGRCRPATSSRSPPTRPLRSG